MKHTFLAVLLFPIICYGQYQNLKLDKSQFFFEKVYSLDSSDEVSVERQLTLSIPKLKDVTDFHKTTDIITAKIENALIDYKKYGGKWGNTLALLNHPFFADVSIVWKDKKYKVFISNMYFIVGSLGQIKCSDIFTKKRGTELDTTKAVLTGGQYLERYLSDLFQLNEDKNEDW